MIPKIIFKYSWIYDERWKEQMKSRRWKNQKYPSSKKILAYIKKVRKMWNKNGNQILKELSEITGLKWKSEIICCYVVGRCIPFSDPLTVPVYDKYPDYFIDNLVHELIHNIFTQNGNLDKSKKAWEYINKKYKKEPLNTRIHIPLHSIHSHIYIKFFDKSRLDRDILLISFLPEYKRSWEIVQEEGYENIIKEFVKRI